MPPIVYDAIEVCGVKYYKHYYTLYILISHTPTTFPAPLCPSRESHWC